ncbi:hypothetical protein Kpol_2002p108 [Vanderwaltozyma polyspora DSM 70294]|uniref:Sfi1 spindle body domain-containing protein n=1 Tax=Vanderwaltozyma polyspora (strain ATCC 22028 / DSM 70294 / BCRC 21397 / CBS 2163 / NBRC 10782 / NRRL Y-8283 / UCD 57-17) TaxID=436907 RepID=A7TFM1_VANPO|nr:uncharacterized protein Kpol_2002p108 [Vanderwaltozyma polyspora DSM 70294]EDO19035.1 hypothetical protein Kpol_2002p108 [Vanderwaltozyma polyspora DSM 70294]
MSNDDDDDSTEALITEDMLSSSTRSLLNEPVENLLERVHITDLSVEELDDSGPESIETEIIRLYNSDSKKKIPSEDLELTALLIPNSLNQNIKYNPELKLLYDKIQVMLIRNSMSSDFLKVFKRYVGILVHEGYDPNNDHFVNELRNELVESFEITSNMEEIISSFILNPNTLEMKLALYEHNKERELLTMTFKKLQFVFLMKGSLNKLEDVWNEYLRRKYFLTWNRNFRYYRGHLIRKADSLNRFRVISNGFDKWLDNRDSNRSKALLADNYFINNKFISMKNKSKSLDKLRITSENKYVTNSMKKAFQLWKLNYLSRQFCPKRFHTKKEMIIRWKNRYNNNSVMKEKSRLTNYVFTVLPYYKNWSQLAAKKIEDQTNLNILERKFLLKKFLNKMSDIVHNNYLVKKQDILGNKRCLRYFFEKIWLKRFNQRINLYSFHAIQEKKLKRKYTLNWITQTKLMRHSSIHLENSYIQNSFNIWRKKYECENRLKIYQQTLLKNFFEVLVTKFRLELKVRDFKTKKLLKFYFEKMRRRYEISKNLNLQAANIEKTRSNRKMVKRWKSKCKKVRTMNEKSVLFQKLRFFTLISQKMIKIENLSDVVLNKCEVNDSKLREQYMQIWLNRFNSKRKYKYELILHQYNKRRRALTLDLFLSLWYRKLTFFRDNCNSKAVYTRDNLLKRRSFGLFLKKITNINKLYEVGSQIRKDSVTSRMYFKWREKLEFLNDLEKMAILKRNEKDLSLLLNHLNIWSMKLLKIRRNQEMIEIFRNRWRRATIRGLLLLWKNRTENSPRKKRIERHKNIMDPAHLVTPMRDPPFAESQTIPGSELIKNYRIEAVKFRYSRAKRLVPSPIKSSVSLGSSVKEKLQVSAASYINERISPPRLAIEKINKNLASKVHEIRFDKIPNVVKLNPLVDHSALETDEDEDGVIVYDDDSPTRRVSRGLDR